MYKRQPHYPSAKHDQHTLLEGHLPQGFYRAQAQMESGEFKKRNLPYGYRWDEEHSNMVCLLYTSFKYRDEYQQTLEYILGYADELDIAV